MAELSRTPRLAASLLVLGLLASLEGHARQTAGPSRAGLRIGGIEVSLGDPQDRVLRDLTAV